MKSNEISEVVELIRRDPDGGVEAVAEGLLQQEAEAALAVRAADEHGHGRDPVRRHPGVVAQHDVPDHRIAGTGRGFGGEY